ncbi:MAG: 16S rRNA (uracil(1498)-N(3))-methyltransferase [Pseudomonadota bacterium]
MPVPRFYCPAPLFYDITFELPSQAAHHAHRVLRLRVHDAVQVFDGLGQALDATIIEISGKRVVLGKLLPRAVELPSPLHIVLAQAMCSSEKMDWVVQKATELGAAAIQPVQTERSVARLSGERAEKRADHWRSVTIAACEQCGRNLLPQVDVPQEFTAWLAQLRSLPGTKFILMPEGTASLHAQPKPQGAVTLLIGPEGGFSAGELIMAQQAGCVAVSLGPRVLRTETAAVAGIAALQTLWGDFSP